jgi:hypothetical protein
MFVFVLALALGCDGGEAKKTSGGDAAATACPADVVVGTWKMVSVFCDEDTDVTPAIVSEGGITEMRLQIQDNGTNCTVVGTSTGPTCTETESVVLQPDSPGRYLAMGKGVTDCQPAQCTFNAMDAPCAVGDRAGTTTASIADFRSDGSTFTLSSRPPAGLCGGYGQRTTITYAKIQ